MTDLKDNQLQELKDHLKEVVKETVNGKIDKLHKEMIEANERQDRKLEEIKESVAGVVELYGTSSKFIRGLVSFSRGVGYIGGAVVVIWALLKYVILSAITK